MSKHLTILLITVSALLATAETTNTKHVQIDNMPPTGGTLYVAVYDAKAAEGWQSTPIVQLHKYAPPKASTLMVQLDLPNGHYAVRAFVDINQNGYLDTDSAGRPLEPFAISLGAGRKRPSVKFADAIIILDNKNDNFHMSLRHPRVRQGDSTTPLASPEPREQ